MTERKFTRNLMGRNGMAQQLRESVSKVIHQDLLLSKPIIADPIDFEGFILKNKTLIQNDPQRELLLYPNDDVSEVILPRKFRTTTSGIPSFHTSTSDSDSPKNNNCSSSNNNNNGNSTENGSVNGKEKEKEHSSMGNLLTRQSLKTYETSNHMILYKYAAYGGTCGDLPKNAQIESLREEVYEIDTDPDREESRTQKDSVTKQGYLFKGADTTSDRMFAHIGSKSFKRRYCYLRHEVDGTYILEIHKDEKQCDAKTTIVMDFCSEVVQNPKRGRYCFELKMSEGGRVTLAAEDESDMDDWIKKLTSVLQQNKIQEDKRAASLERTAPPPSPSCAVTFGTLKGLDQSMNPQLMRYGRETDMSIGQARRENRKRLFGTIQNQFVRSPATEPIVEPFKEIFGQRILIKCEEIRFRLQASIDDSEKLCQIEPYITSLALYDAKVGRKLTENFYFDLNEAHVRELLHCNENVSPCCSPKAIKTNGTSSPHVKNGNKETNGHHNHHNNNNNNNHYDYSQDWVMHPRQAVLSVTAPHPDIFIVVRIEKILQGGINQSSEPYLKTSKDAKLGAKTYKSIKQYAQKVGHYRMPFAWTARPLFRLYSSDLDNNSEFPGIFRQDCNKLKDDEIIKVLNDYRKPEKLSKLTLIPGSLKLSVKQIVNEFPKNCLSTTLAPIKPFSLPPIESPTLEIAEFPGNSERDIHPYTIFINHLFIYPTSLNFETQKIFSRARNIAVTIELRSSDNADAKAIECIYGRCEQEKVFVSSITCPVLHHNTTPTWYEEIKMKLPTNLSPQHHLLFTFSHVSCDIKKKEPINSAVTSVGFAWLPLLNKGKLNIEEQSLSVAASLPSGYLSIQPLGLGKGNAGPEIQWIDNQKQIFNVNFRLDSTVLSTDQHLHNLFAHAEKLLESVRGPIPSEMETCKVLKAAHAIHISAVINFLPTIFDQLFILLVSSFNEDVSCNIIRLLINLIHMVAEEAGRKELMLSYAKYNFKTPSIKCKSNSSPSAINTVHGEICKHLPSLLNPANTDFLLVNKFMKFSSIIFDIIIKSMAHFLLSSGRIKMHRNERFPKEYEKRIENLFNVLMPYLISRYKELPLETHQLNKSLSVFAKKCLTLMDRGFVFKLIRQYMDKWSPGDPRSLQEFKFQFVQEVCSHEHFIPLNLPLIISTNHRTPDILNQFCLSEEFCRQHFLVGLMLQEVRSSLNEISHIRKLALGIFKDLLAKHDLDDRYQQKGQLSRIAMLYVPWLGIVIENINRIPDGLESKETTGHNRISSNSSYVFARDMTPKMISQVSTPTPSTNSTLTNTPKSKRFTLHVDNSRVSSHFKDMIAGHAALKNGVSTSSLNSDCSSMSQETTVVIRNCDDTNSSFQFGHNRSISMTQTPAVPRTDKFAVGETRDMLICFLFTIKHLSQDHMITWWHNCTATETASFFQVLDLCLIFFRYVGKKNIQLNDQSKSTFNKNKSSTLPARIVNSESDHSNISSIHETGTLNHQNRENLVEETAKLQKALQDSNLATEIGMIILDCMGLYCVQFKESMVDGAVLPKIAQVYLRFLQLGQSETLSRHVFAAMRAFINNFSQALFKGTAMLCGQFVYELLKCCDSRLPSVRQESCAVLYLLMRSNFEFSGRKGLTRVHLQVIISVSQMIGSVIGLNNARFQESLSLINSYATSDKAMKGTGFPMEVKDLTKRVRTVLMATHAMQARQTDPERLLELQLSLANSYASTPELRHTWLVTMARNHEANNNISEAACCHLHIAALMAEYLKLKGSDLINFGAESFAKISRNIPRDEKGLKLDCGAQDSQYTETLLLDQLKNCADFLDRSERLECLGELYRLIIPILEYRRDYSGLIESYNHLSQSYQRVIEFNRNGKRLLGRFYRIICYGQIYFDDEHAVEYIFKEPKVTSLSEISLRLKKQFEDRFGADVVKMIMDSNQVNVNDLDPKIAYIQVTNVTPYFIKDELEIRQTEFEQNHDIDTFMFETPFTKNGAARCNLVEDQWKRRTILTTHYSFPYVLKRIPVKDRQIVELSPIEVAIDEMQTKISELADVVFAPTIDVKKLQLRLQGSVAVQVNAGPLAYANSFLDPKLCSKYDPEKVEDLKEVFREFVKVCYAALQVNGRVISTDQVEYHNSLKENFSNMCLVLAELMSEILIALDDQSNPHRNSLALFSAISGTPNNSSTA